MKAIKCLGFLFLIINIITGCKNKNNILAGYYEITYEEYLNRYTYLSEDHVLKSIDYSSLINKLDDKETFILYIGGDWCINCQSSIKYINSVAIEENIEIIYNFDTRISKDKDKSSDIRNQQYKKNYQFFTNLLDKLDYSIGSYLSVPAVLKIINGKVELAVIEEYFYDEELDILLNKENEDVTISYINKLRDIFK